MLLVIIFLPDSGDGRGAMRWRNVQIPLMEKHIKIQNLSNFYDFTSPIELFIYTKIKFGRLFAFGDLS